MENKVNFLKLDNNQKVNYIKSEIIKDNINHIVEDLMKLENKNLDMTKLLISSLDDKIVSKKVLELSNLTNVSSPKTIIYSRIIAYLSFLKKTTILNTLFKSLDENDLKSLARYEYQNKTDISYSSKVFDKYCQKYKDDALKSLELNDEEVLMLTTEIKRYDLNTKVKVKRKKKPIMIKACIIFVLLLLVICTLLFFYSKDMIDKYNGLIYPGTYLNDINLDGKKIDDIEKIVQEEKNKILSGTLTVTNPNGNYKFTYEELGIKIDSDKTINQIKNYNKGLNFFSKIYLIKNKSKSKTFFLKGRFDDNSVNDFMKLLKEKLNVDVRSDGVIVDDKYSFSYDAGVDGFVLNEEETKKLLKEVLTNLKEESVLEAKGEVIKKEIKYEHLSKINKKISSYSTYFVNQGNRGHNIVLAASKLNNTVVMPGDVFSYLKVVGPYNAASGYLPAPIYLNGVSAVANGGGVCQLASTIYNAQLRAGLKTIERRNHTYASSYVTPGLDATVYSTTTDYKFKNEYEYPVYIVSYVIGGKLTVDIWSNENAMNGKTYEPYSVKSNGGYLAYLKVIENGKVIETRYLDKSVYKTH